MEPSSYNAAVDLVDRHLPVRASKVAFVDERGSYTFAELAERVDRCANALRTLGLEAEHRIALCLLDSIDFPAAFLGAIKAGIVPIPVNTLFPPADFAYILADSRARAVIVSVELEPQLREAARIAEWRGRFIVAGDARDDGFDALLGRADRTAAAAPTRADDVCFWLYSSGSTGKPKGAVHVQTSLVATAELFAQPVLGFAESDVVYSAAKLFFAYGLGNALTFPLSVGATSVLAPGRATPELVATMLRRSQATIFCGVPTLFNAMLVSPHLPARDDVALRLCTSAGEVLPAEVGRAWTERMGVEIIDGIGSTEMLHIFVSNRPGAVRYGTTGYAVTGYRVRLIDERGLEAAPGEIGELEVSGPTSAAYYWNNREKSRATFAGEWTRTGDKFRFDDDGALVHCGRADDMLKVSGIWVSPMEVESVLIAHESVLEAAVVGVVDEYELVKPKAFVVLKPGYAQSEPGDLERALQQHVKAHLAPYKYPRWIEFVTDLPKTATGKIRRHVLRDGEAEKRAARLVAP